MSTTKTYRIARKFAEDHWYRDCGETDVIVAESKTTLQVQMDEEGYEDMLSDAYYYWECRDQFDGYYRDVIQSAKRVMASLLKAGSPGEGMTFTERKLQGVS